MQRANDPILQSVNIDGDIPVDFWAPRRELCFVVDEAVDGLFAQLAHKIDSLLQVETHLVHHDRDHVVRVAFGLLDVVREDVLWHEIDLLACGAFIADMEDIR